ncbi:hypothetical protein SF2A_03235 [Shigella flexneri G1663]|nr:hypothetical protein SF2A_03235 [Shigella flexneri G1663]
MSNAKLPDALRLSGLHDLCNILNLRAFVGRIRRSRRIRQEIANNPKRRALRRFFCFSSRINSASQFIHKINLKSQNIIK